MPKSNCPVAMACDDATEPKPRAMSKSMPRAFMIPVARATKTWTELPCASQASVNLTVRGSAMAGNGSSAAPAAAVVAKKSLRDNLRRSVNLTSLSALPPPIGPAHQLLSQRERAEQRDADHAEHKQRGENDTGFHA